MFCCFLNLKSGLLLGSRRTLHSWHHHHLFLTWLSAHKEVILTWYVTYCWNVYMIHMKCTDVSIGPSLVWLNVQCQRFFFFGGGGPSRVKKRFLDIINSDTVTFSKICQSLWNWICQTTVSERSSIDMFAGVKDCQGNKANSTLH